MRGCGHVRTDTDLCEVDWGGNGWNSRATLASAVGLTPESREAVVTARSVRLALVTALEVLKEGSDRLNLERVA